MAVMSLKHLKQVWTHNTRAIDNLITITDVYVFMCQVVSVGQPWYLVRSVSAISKRNGALVQFLVRREMRDVKRNLYSHSDNRQCSPHALV